MINGIIGKKVGMTQLFAPDGTVTPVTVIKAGPCVVVQKKTAGGRDGYDAGSFLLDDNTRSGDKILVDQFADGDIVDVVGKSKGRGFAGTIKRHNFNRGPESHGSMNVRAPGSIGASAYPSRVVKGMCSSGHMGDVRVTIKRLTVARVDAENNLLMIHGAVPGANGSVVVVKKAARQRKG